MGGTQGDTEHEALEVVVADYIENGKPIPAPSKLRGRKYRSNSLPGLQSVKVELHSDWLPASARPNWPGVSIFPAPTLTASSDCAINRGSINLKPLSRHSAKELMIDIRDAA